MILGLDQSLTSSGIVITSGDSIQHYEVFRTVPTGKDYTDDSVLRGMELGKRIAELCDTYNVEHINYEHLALGAFGNATRNLALFLGATLSTVRHYTKSRVTISGANIKRIKKLATGSGNAGKQDMWDALSKQQPEVAELFMSFGKTKGRFDLVDAYWIGKYGEQPSVRRYMHTQTGTVQTLDEWEMDYIQSAWSANRSFSEWVDVALVPVALNADNEWEEVL